MKFEIPKSIEILERTPFVLETMLSGLSEEWVMNNEGPDTWSPYDVIGHLIHGERTDWLVRMEVILSCLQDKRFAPYDRFAQFIESKGKTLEQLLMEFKDCRLRNLQILKDKNLNEVDLDKTGIHPRFGSVTLRQLFSTWVTHDMTHIAQIVRVMAKQYKIEVGPWVEYVGVLNR
ncbi:MAG: DinB family protein [Ignavibacteria bacterium]|nr:DinB family protein [Ignavibacteria bacterium]